MNEENIITITDNGKEYHFEEIDRIELENGKKYIAIIPIEDELAPDEDDGEVIILHVIEKGDKTILEQIENEAELEEVFEIFEGRFADFLSDDEDDSAQTDDESD